MVSMLTWMSSLPRPGGRSDFVTARLVGRRVAIDLGRDYSRNRGQHEPGHDSAPDAPGPDRPYEPPGAWPVTLPGVLLTHPGQWVSFAAISGILAARMLGMSAMKFELLPGERHGGPGGRSGIAAGVLAWIPR